MRTTKHSNFTHNFLSLKKKKKKVEIQDSTREQWNISISSIKQAGENPTFSTLGKKSKSPGKKNNKQVTHI